MQKIFNINVQEPFLTHIKDGIKKVEGRLNKGKFLEINIGDEIIFNEDFRIKIKNKVIYKTFWDMIVFEGIKNVIPNAKSIKEAEDVYYNFYTKDDEEKFGVAAIEMELL